MLFFKKLHTKALKVFFVYSAVLAIVTAIAFSSQKFFEARNFYLLVLRIYNILEYALVITFIFYTLKSVVVRKIIIYSIIPFSLFAIIDYLTNDRSQFNNHSNIVSSLLLIMIIIYFFYEKMKTVVMVPLYLSIIFWISVAFFLYFAGTFFFFLFIKSNSDKQFKEIMNTTYSSVTLLKNIILCLSLLASETEEKDEETLHIPHEMNLDDISLTSIKNS